MRGLSRAVVGAKPPEPSREQLLELAASLRADGPLGEERMLLKVFRVSAVAAAMLLAFAIAAAAYLAQRANAAAHEAMVLDYAAARSRPAAYAPDPVSDERRAEERVMLAQWIADDLRGR